MLVLSRKVGESVIIGEGIVVQVLEVCGRRIRLGIEAPRDVPVRRQELPVLLEVVGTGCSGVRKSR
jgi:carbon storage regulator